jgi:photosystem II stability/assembly factor-like uncharacterized protein
MFALTKVWLLIAILLAVFAGFVSAGMSSWQPMRSPQAGHSDGFSHSWDSDHSWWVVYAVDSCSRLYSLPGAVASWDSIWADQAVAPVSVSSEPNNYRTIYIARDPEKVWKSVDGGNVWESKSIGITNSHPLCLVMAPSVPSVLYLGCTPDGSNPTVFKTTNGGELWFACSSYPGGGVTALAVHPGDAQYVLAGYNNEGLGGGGLWESRDGGNNWVKRILNGDVFSIVWADASTAYAGWQSPVGPYRIQKSVDGGVTWSILPNSPDLKVFALTVASGRVFAGGNPKAPGVAALYRSDDGGTSWVPKVFHLQDPLVRSLHTSGDGKILAGAERAVYRTTDLGDTWDQWDQGWRVHYGYETVQTVLPGVIYAHDDANIWKTTDGGGAWTLMYSAPSGPVKGRGVSEIVAHLVDPDKVAICYEGDGDMDALYRSSDGGWAWEFVWAGSSAMQRKFFAANPTSSDYVSLAGNTKYFLRSSDWWLSKEVFDHLWNIHCLAVDPQHYDILYRGTTSFPFDQLQKSVDWGYTWFTASTGLPNETVEDVIVDPHSSDIAYCGTTNGIYKTTNGGSAWFLLTNQLHGEWPENTFAIDASEPSILALLQGSGVHLSVDGGAAWTNVSQGLPGTKVKDLQIDYNYPDVIYAAIRQDPTPRNGDSLYTLTPTWQFKSLTPTLRGSWSGRRGRATSMPSITAGAPPRTTSTTPPPRTVGRRGLGRFCWAKAVFRPLLWTKGEIPR